MLWKCQLERELADKVLSLPSYPNPIKGPNYLNFLIFRTGFRLWRQYWRQYWGYIFFGGISPSKIGHIAPFLATIQRLSETCGFLSKKRSEGCFVLAAPSLLLARTYFIIALNMWFVSWESTPARVKASERGAKCFPRGEYPVKILKIFIRLQ
jgi:hypothetical protein